MKFHKIQVIDLNQFKSLTDIFSKREHEIFQNPLEQTYHQDWQPYEYFQNANKVQYKQQFQPQLQLISSQCAGVSMVVNKMVFKAVQTGYLDKSRQFMGMDVEIFDQNQDITSEIKKNGLYFDMENKLELHLGDTLTFYFCKGN